MQTKRSCRYQKWDDEKNDKKIVYVRGSESLQFLISYLISHLSRRNYSANTVALLWLEIQFVFKNMAARTIRIVKDTIFSLLKSRENLAFQILSTLLYLRQNAFGIKFFTVTVTTFTCEKYCEASFFVSVGAMHSKKHSAAQLIQWNCILWI